MKRLLSLLIVMAIVLPSCQKGIRPVYYSDTGYIKGQILSNMVCGYGYVITSGDSVRKFVAPLPASSGIDLKTATFPIAVKYNYHVAPDPNPCHFVVIDAVQKIN